MGTSKLDTLEGRPDFIKKFVKSYGKTNDDILAADATETAASAKVAHQGWTIPAGGNDNPNAMRETIIAMNIGSDIGTDDDAGLGVGGGSSGPTYTKMYEYGQDIGNGYNDASPFSWNMNSSYLELQLYNLYPPGGPGPHDMNTIPWLNKWKHYGAADNGSGNYQSDHSAASINMMRIYTGTNAGGSDDGFNLDGSFNFFFYSFIADNMGTYLVGIRWPDYMGAASGDGAPWADPGHPGYPLSSSYSNAPPVTAAGQAPVDFFNWFQYYFDNYGLRSTARIKMEVAQANPNNAMPQANGFTPAA